MEGQSVVLQLPFYPTLSVTVVDEETGEFLADATVICRFLDKDAWRQAEKEDRLAGRVRMRPFPSGTLAAVLGTYQQQEGNPVSLHQARSDEHGLATMQLPGSGFLLLECRAPGYRPGLVETDLSPSQSLPLSLPMKRRPILVGEILGLEADAAVSVKLAVLLDEEDPDLSMADHQEGAASTGLRDVDGREFRVVRRRVSPDPDGTIHESLPRGEKYMVEIYAGEGGYFTEVYSLEEVLASAQTPLHWTIPGAEDSRAGFSLKVLDPDGMPAVGAYLIITPHNDQPWFRVSPRVHVDEDGMARIPWFPDDEMLAFGIILPNQRGGDAIECIPKDTDGILRMRVR